MDGINRINSQIGPIVPQEAEKISDVQGFVEATPGGIAQLPDSIETFQSNAPSVFKAFEATDTKAIATSELGKRNQQLQELKYEKQELMAKIVEVQNQIAALESSSVQSQSPQGQSQIANLQQQLNALQSQLAKVDSAIATLLDEIQKLQGQENSEQDANNTDTGISKDIEKAAESFADILNTIDDL